MDENSALQQSPSDKKKIKNVIKKADEKTIQEKSNKEKTFIYLGANIPGGILNHGAVFKGYPKYLSELFEKTPEIKKLFIDIKDIVAFKEAVNRKGSEESRLYQRVLLSTREELSNVRI